MRIVARAVARSKLILHRIKDSIHHIASKQPNFMNTNSGTLPIKVVKAFSDTLLSYRVPIPCSDGRLFKVDPWINSLSL